MTFFTYTIWHFDLKILSTITGVVSKKYPGTKIVNKRFNVQFRNCKSTLKAVYTTPDPRKLRADTIASEFIESNDAVHITTASCG